MMETWLAYLWFPLIETFCCVEGGKREGSENKGDEWTSE